MTKRAAPQSQALALPRGACDQPDLVYSASELSRLELLIPDLARIPQRDVQAYALAYVEHYRDDVLQLEQEWAFLSAALTQAWRREAYPAVVYLVAGLALPAGRLANLAEAEYILRLGIEASRRTEDRAHLVAFSNRLSGLLFARGKYQEGWRLWNSSLALAEIPPAVPALWEPLASFAYIADAYLTNMLDQYLTPPRFRATIQSACQSDDPDRFAVARFVRGFYARLVNDLDNAYDDLSSALRSLALQAAGAPPVPSRQLLMLATQAELARAQGDYARSQAHTETALALAQVFSDHYTVAALLIDQGLFTYHQGQFADTRAASLRLRDLACQMETPRAYNYSRLFEQLLAGPAPELLSPAPANLAPLASDAAPTELHEPISEREREVLQLVAVGLSNQEIARRLVITPATVKKHLEHIYAKLDVHSRTAALARIRLLNLPDQTAAQNTSFGE
ncbi:MAG TPA: helix-turn-helix transcriptional regulator [Ktedonobacterales bacterium]|jgi:DNA-binding CsgD family transcriptional regulator